MASYFIWHWWLVIVHAGSQSHKNASKKLRCRPHEFFLKKDKIDRNKIWAKKKQNHAIFSKISNANIRCN